MDLQDLFIDTLPVAFEWVDSLVFIGICSWLLASLEVLGVPTRDRFFFPQKSRRWLFVMLLTGASFHAVLLIALNLFPLQEGPVFPIIIGALALLSFLAALKIVVHFPAHLRKARIEWLFYPVLAGVASILLVVMRKDFLTSARHGDELVMAYAFLLALFGLVIFLRLSNRRKNGWRKSSVFFQSLGLLAVLILGFLLLSFETKKTSQQFYQYILSIVKLSSRMLPLEKIILLTGTVADESTPHYPMITRALTHVIDDFEQIRYSYLWTVRDGKLLFLADGSKTDVSRPGDVFRDASEEDYEYSDLDTAYALQPFRDPWGVWVSANFPLKDPTTGKKICWHGIDFQADQYFSYIGRARLQIMSITGLLLLAIGLYRSVRQRSILEVTYERQLHIVREGEHRKIASRIHDDLGQLLTAIGLEISHIERSLKSHATHLLPDVQRILGLVQQAGERGRDIAFGMSPYLARPEEFSEDFRRFALELGHLLHLEVRLVLPENSFAVKNAAVAENLLRILQESLSNAAKHGDRLEATVRLSQEKRFWLLCIENPESAKPGLQHSIRPGIGLRIMEARVQDLKGRFFFHHHADGRAQVTCEFPIDLFRHPTEEGENHQIKR